MATRVRAVYVDGVDGVGSACGRDWTGLNLGGGAGHGRRGRVVRESLGLIYAGNLMPGPLVSAQHFCQDPPRFLITECIGRLHFNLNMTPLLDRLACKMKRHMGWLSCGRRNSCGICQYGSA